MCVNLIISIIVGAIFGLLVGSGIILVATPLIFSLMITLSILFLVLLFLVLPLVERRCYMVVKELVFAILVSIILTLLGLTVSVVVSDFLIGLYFLLVGAVFLFEIFSLKDLILCIVSGRRE